jgi:hypothetical protein
MVERLRKIFGILSLGNIRYQDGDILWKDTEFVHEFSDERNLRDEFKQGGFKVEYLHIARALMRGGAILRPK